MNPSSLIRAGAAITTTLCLCANVTATEPHIFKNESGGTLPYHWHAPANPEPGRKYPLVIFLHGAGERGSDNQAQLKHGVHDILEWTRKNDQPCFVIAPQCPTDVWWAKVNMDTKQLVPDAPMSTPTKHLVALLEETLKKHPVDKSRIYLTGLSMGGFGSWFLAAEKPAKFAALVPVCGGGDPAKAARIKDLPVWAFHGGKDNVVPPERSRTMVEALKNAGGKPKYTEYPDAGHDSWTVTYRNAKMLEWMFAQHKEHGS